MIENLQIDDINLDEENPRVITEENKQKLKHSMKEFQNISSIVFNVQTKTLVSGHQRFKILKELYGNKLNLQKTNNPEVLNINYDTNYSGFSIRLVNWDIKKQKAANLVANDDRTSGNWDIDKLCNIFDNYELESYDDIFQFDDLVKSTNIEENTKSEKTNENIDTITLKCEINQTEKLINELNFLNKEKFNNTIFIKNNAK